MTVASRGFSRAAAPEDWVGLNQVQIRREEVKWEGKGSVSGSILWKCQELRGQDACEEARVFGTLGVHVTGAWLASAPLSPFLWT